MPPKKSSAEEKTVKVRRTAVGLEEEAPAVRTKQGLSAIGEPDDFDEDESKTKKRVLRVVK